MWSMPTGIGAAATDPRQRLLDRTIEYLAGRGISDLSLRELAGALGTSHRMLIYHFGSKEGLFVEVIRTVERRQRDRLAQPPEAAGGSMAEAARQFWRRLSDPALAPYERLFFEIYGQALQGRSYALPLLDGIIDDWLGPLAAMLREAGLAADAARAEARLGIAVVRGLLLDLLATGDTEGVDEAFERHLAAYAGTRQPGHGRG